MHSTELQSDTISDVSRLVASIAEHFEVLSGDQASVEAACEKLRRKCLDQQAGMGAREALALSKLLGKRSGKLAEIVFELLRDTILTHDGSTPALSNMLCARDDTLAYRTLMLLVRLAETRTGIGWVEILQIIAREVEKERSVFARQEMLQEIRLLIHAVDLDWDIDEADALLALLLQCDHPDLRRLAARLLDLEGQPVSPELVAKVVGTTHAEFLSPYLTFTRASHQDLISIAQAPDLLAGFVRSLQQAEASCGRERLLRIVSGLGWSRVNVSLEVCRYRRADIEGSLPLYLTSEEWLLFRDCDHVSAGEETYFIVAQGSRPAAKSDSSGDGSTVEAFRRLNLLHAVLLEKVLDMVPLTRGMVLDILAKMDEIVSIFARIFAGLDKECDILDEVYRDLRQRILDACPPEDRDGDISPELTQLVRMFEDPASLGKVRTLHGLKRYLHQRGLHNGFRLVDTTHHHGRTVSLAMLKPGDVLIKSTDIQYSNFETTISSEARTDFPLAIRLLIDSLRQPILYGLHTLPGISIFCYGAEVHYYITFRNHPVFLRIDFSPPLRGGMIDLQYYGVSKYELSDHPDISLPALQLFLKTIGYEVMIEDTRIHARCDKESILDLETLSRRARALLSLIPFLMDVDWTIGALELPVEARKKVTHSWAASFADWGTLPFQQLLTADRRGIVAGVAVRHGKHEEITWDGQGEYADQFIAGPPESFIARFNARLEALGLNQIRPLQGNGRRAFGHARLERKIFQPLAAVLRRGELITDQNELVSASPELYSHLHAVEQFAEILHAGPEAIEPAALIASLLAPLEKSLRFETTGYLEGCRIQSAQLSLRDEIISLHVLRDRTGNARLAMYARDAVLYRHRNDSRDKWQTNARFDDRELELLLRSNSYLTEGDVNSRPDAKAEARAFLEEFSTMHAQQRTSLLPGERIAQGLSASPGRQVARVMLGVKGRLPSDVRGHIIVMPSLGPEHNPYIFHCAGVVSTSGAALSHAGLIATQYEKPALIVSGRWHPEDGDSPALDCLASAYVERRRQILGFDAVVRDNIRTVSHALCDNDLVVLDADGGKLHLLGQKRDTLELYEGILQMRKLRRQLDSAANQQEVLAIRGRRVHARHQVEKVLDHLDDLVAAKHAVLESLLSIPRDYREDQHEDREIVLARLLKNPHVGTLVRNILLEVISRLESRFLDLRNRALSMFESATLPAEFVSLRLQFIRLAASLKSIKSLLESCCVEHASLIDIDDEAIDEPALRRMTELRDNLETRLLKMYESSPSDPALRHQHRLLTTFESILGEPAPQHTRLQHCFSGIDKQEQKLQQDLSAQFVIPAADCCAALTPLTGRKAANLGELRRLTLGEVVPDWFVVADPAFKLMLESPVHLPPALRGKFTRKAVTLSESIEHVLHRKDLETDQQSNLIGQLWDSIEPPARLTRELRAACARLVSPDPESAACDDAGSQPMVAVRSSACEEDRETDMCAGEFETYLFISGTDEIIRHIKRVWSGMWTARAIQSRQLLNADAGETYCGVIVQHAVLSRISGVLLTVNLPGNNMEEMIINVGLGLGEGIVSGKVAADHVVVNKRRFMRGEPRSYRYTTAEKPEQIVFDPVTGRGTRLKQSLYHQRMRPALEFHELQELVTVAARLEAVFGYPLDIEFAFEDTRLKLLQVRPIPSCLADIRDTVERHPLTAGSERGQTPNSGKEK